MGEEEVQQVGVQKIKNVRVYLASDNSTSMTGDAVFDSVNELITFKYDPECDDLTENEVMYQIPYSSVLYWALVKADTGDDEEEDVKLTNKELAKVPNVKFFRKMFGNK